MIFVGVYMKKRIMLLVCSFFIFFSILDVNALVNISDKYYVSDYSNILSNESEDYIIYNSNYLKNSFNSEIVVVTVSDLEGYSIEDYTDGIYEKFNIGKSTDEKSILILISKNDRQIRVKVGSGYSSYFTDYLIAQYIDDYFIPYLSDDDWNKGIINGYNAFYKTICNFYNIDTNSIVVENNNNFFYKHRVDLLLFGVIIIMFSFNYLYKFFIKKYCLKKKTEYYEEALFFIIVMVDVVCFYYAFIFDISYFLILFVSLILAVFGIANFNDDKIVGKRKNKKRKKK